MSVKAFFQKLVAFTKRNLSAMAISFCMIFALSLITAVVVTRMNKNQTRKQIASPDSEIVTPTNAEEMVEFTMPVEGATEGLPYANDRLVKYKTLGKWQTHSAIDLIAIAGTKVVAAFDGTIESVETTSLWGTIVVIDHGNGLKTTYKSLFLLIFWNLDLLIMVDKPNLFDLFFVYCRFFS